MAIARMSVPAQTFTGFHSSGAWSPTLFAINQMTNQINVIRRGYDGGGVGAWRISPIHGAENYARRHRTSGGEGLAAAQRVATEMACRHNRRSRSENDGIDR
jgi:hypothetical protein